jgi:hypothetical protein
VPLQECFTAAYTAFEPQAMQYSSGGNPIYAAPTENKFDPKAEQSAKVREQVRVGQGSLVTPGSVSSYTSRGAAVGRHRGALRSPLQLLGQGAGAGCCSIQGCPGEDRQVQTAGSAGTGIHSSTRRDLQCCSAPWRERQQRATPQGSGTQPCHWTGCASILQQPSSAATQ